MEWLRQMSLRKSLIVITIICIGVGIAIYHLILFLVRSLTDTCICGSGVAIFFNFAITISVPIVSAMLFYKIKLKNPLIRLNMGSKKIMENDLDFSITTDSKDELGQLCCSFELMRSALLKSNKQLWQQMVERKRLNAAFAHDLRNPVTVLKGSAAVLHKGLEQDDLTTEVTREGVSLITQYANRIECYIQAMTSVQKLEELACNPKEVNWLKLVKELKSSLSILGANTDKKIQVFNSSNNRKNI